MSCYANASCSYPSTGTAPQLFSSALQFFAASQCLIKTVDVPESGICDCQEFDYIIVGAGTAGCVLANRLTECENSTVLLIEAGDEAPVEARIPNLDKGMFFTKYDWRYRTANDSRINQANQNGSIIWPRGKMLGGSSNLNAMLYVRGVKADYDAWYKAGNKEWNYKTVLKHFKKAESFQNMESLKNPVVNATYGKKGPLFLNKFNSTYRPITEDVLSAWKEMGVNNVVDLNIVDDFKSGIATVTAANGVRSSGDYTYIKPVKNRPNLTILKNTLVTRILLDKFIRAYGVEADRNGRKSKYFARKEVIVSAGTINSPQLLMLSGIGRKEHLNSKNISCKVDSPMVGKNLQDHCIIPVPICAEGPVAPDNATQYFGAIEYLYNRTGYLAQNSFSDILAFYSLDGSPDTNTSTSVSSQTNRQPQYQSHMTILWKNLSNIRGIFRDRFKYLEPVPSSFENLNKNHIIYLFQFSILHPISRGNILLQTNNPRDYPLIYPNYFLDPRDLDVLVAGIRKLTEIVNTTYFKSIGGFLGRVNWPACDKFRLDSEDYWKCICINMVLTVYHPVGTCKMGPNPETSVVDSRLRVHGVKSLRVIDASIMPTITSGNTNCPTTMIGELGATMVKEDNTC